MIWNKNEISADPPIPLPLMQQLLRLDPDAGKLYWRERPIHMFKPSFHRAETRCRMWNSRYAGTEAFTAKSKGYCVGRLSKKTVRAHHVVFALHHGRWPAGQIDHQDGDRSNNKPSNLREVNAAENGRNTKTRADNTSGRVGVYFDKRNGRWFAAIGVNRKFLHLGTFADPEAAAKAREAAEIKYGFHENHGRRA